MRIIPLIILSPKQHLAIASAFIWFAFFGDTHASQMEAATVNANDSYTVCHNVAIPPTYAVIGLATNYGCPNDQEITVAPAQDNLRICNLSETAGGAPFPLPFPADFIVKSIEQVDYLHSQCGGATSVYVIQQVAEGVTACSGSHIPEGWSYVQSLPSNGGCQTTVRNELHKAVDGLRICSLSPYPVVLVIGAVESLAACDVQERFVLRTTSDGIKACGPTRIPTGYVITAADRSGQCGQYSTLTLRNAYDGVVVCPSSPIPSRYVVDAAVPVNTCEYVATGYRLKYIP
jgi:hypothetical protein